MSETRSRLWQEMGLDASGTPADPNTLPIPPIPPEQPARHRLFQEMGMPAPAAPQERDYANMPWTQVAREGVGNIPSSAFNVGRNIYEAVTHPVQTAGAIGQIGTGLYSKAKGLVIDQDPEQKARDEAVVNAIGQDYANRYGSMAGFKKALATDPFSVGMDVSLPLTAGAGALPSGLGKAATIAARAIDPVQGAMWAAGRTAGMARSIGRGAQELQTGVPRNLLEIATQAGASENPAFRDAFLRFNRGEGDIGELSTVARNALEEIRDQASQRYLASMADIRANQTPLPFDLMDNALQEARAHTQFAGIRSPHNFGPANQTLQRAEQLIDAYRRVPAAQTMEGFDKLKRALWDLGEQSGNIEAKRAINKLYDAARSTVAAQDPEYARLMEFYQKHIQNTNDITRGLGLGQKAPVTTTVNRLRNAAKKPESQSLLDQLAATRSGQELPYMLAGAATSRPISDALHSAAGAATGAMLYSAHPVWGPIAAGTAALGTSPKLAGMVNYGAGAAQRYAGAPFRAAQRALPDRVSEALDAVPPGLMHYLPYYGGEVLDAREGRATGGKVDGIEHLVGRLMSLAEKAKKATAQHTKPLLGVDDNAIAHALKTADHAI